eukprot:GEMP01036003.1.p1 GENE.GEMP01036003.1~~GEMP01036003.1.p1  ORF type:complete len:397 (+),score=104.11 GEMP01036003.1:32-1192(+)
MVDIGLKPLFARLTTPRAMVVRMPTPEGHLGPSTVKVVSVNQDDLLSLVYKEAWVGDDEDVQVGDQHTFRIIDIGEVTHEEDSNYLNIKKLNGGMFMQLQMEVSEDVDLWMQGLAVLKQLATSTAEDYDAARTERDENLLALMSLRENIDQMHQRLAEVQQERTDDEPSGEPEDENDEEPHEEPELNLPLHVNEQQSPKAPAEEKILQQARQIELLIQVNEQKENTVQKLTQRLEHSLEMLKAVHEMYDQQKNVLLQQQHVIEELRAERAEQPAPYANDVDNQACNGTAVSESFLRSQNAPAAPVVPTQLKMMRPNGQMNGTKPASMQVTARQQLERLQEQDVVPQFQDLVNIERMIGANGEPTLDSMDDLLTLLKQMIRKPPDVE